MTSATDIITYIGIPLAVLGVLPILYTFTLSILRQRRIRQLLVAHGHVPQRAARHPAGFVVRASPMTSLVEVEMPRYTVAPLPRGDARYWDVATDRVGPGGDAGGGQPLLLPPPERAESTLSMLEEGRVCGFLRGGSWRTFHWRTLVVARKMYRIQYEDELREPPAEIGFAELVEFLMDWGVELDGTGWGKLRSAGLWTPSGTVLLRVAPDETDGESVGEVDVDVDGKDAARVGGGAAAATSAVGDRGDWVLRTSMPDDSDGILTLCVRWPQRTGTGSARGTTRLPPGWGRLRQPRLTEKEDSAEHDTKQDLSATIAAMVERDEHFAKSDSVRFKLDGSAITTVHHESHHEETGCASPLLFPTHPVLGPEWFTHGTSAVLALQPAHAGRSLWTFDPPADTLAFARKDSVPCGVLVLLGILPADAAPQWTSSSSDQSHHDLASAGADQLRRLESRRAAERLESAMPPDQARVARANRELRDRQDQHRRAVDALARRRDRDAQRLQDALVSARVGTPAVARVCVAWLVARGLVAPDSSPASVAGAVLYLLALQGRRETETEVETEVPTLLVLDAWTAWARAGGMKREQYALLERHPVEFCYAACLVGVVHEAAALSAGTGRGRASVDMLECLRMWQKVRLG